MTNEGVPRQAAPDRGNQIIGWCLIVPGLLLIVATIWSVGLDAWFPLIVGGVIMRAFVTCRSGLGGCGGSILDVLWIYGPLAMVTGGSNLLKGARATPPVSPPPSRP